MSTSKQNFKRHGSRYKARRRAVDILFEAEFRDIDPVLILEDRIELSRNQDNQVKPVPEYTQDIVPGVAVHLDAIDDAIASNLSSDWRLDRIPAVDRAVLRVTAWEMLYNPEVDNPVSVTEGVELASEYSNDQAPAYVHAVLDGILKTADLRLADAATTARENDDDSYLDNLIVSSEGMGSTESTEATAPTNPAANDELPNEDSTKDSSEDSTRETTEEN
ncbi:transcription antitermination factor NusB [Corynebacterium falsenii]|uniref:transcription antitermination factor NusB n=2 Tax=Corynebacterium falsenii TaxID=108486 RepID=UPI001CC9FF4D|nr:transcription antitermination factor NusB [Corynebacterium falsenii]MDC7103506.1 transcription antitermination factor NusB [Corynebacterium falsenii]UBI06111.1 transcription antitermination factor NusB [Corynebacterium falsenii]